MNIYLTTLLLFVLSNTYAVRNGDNAVFDVMARLSFNGQTCSAVRVSQDFFLTAAHCMRLTKSDDFTIYFKDGDTNQSQLVLKSSVIINKTNYDEELALIPIESNNPYPAVVDLNSPQIDIKQKLTVFGFGYDKSDEKVLKKGELIFDQLLKEDVIKPMIVTIPAQDNHNPCPGDSGGGLFIKGTSKLVGLTSYIENEEKNLYKIAKKKARRSYSFNSAEYFCKNADRAYFISIKKNMDFLNTYLN